VQRNCGPYPECSITGAVQLFDANLPEEEDMIALVLYLIGSIFFMAGTIVSIVEHLKR
jgi:hypothetical protein